MPNPGTLAALQALRQLGISTQPVHTPQTKGLLESGNVDLLAQPKVRNPDGSISTVDSSSYGLDGQEVLLPSVTPSGQHLQSSQAILDEYKNTGRHLGKFDSPTSATNYGKRLHEEYARGLYDLKKIR